MYDINRKQFIFKLSNEKTLNIFYKENTGICISILGKRSIWMEPAVLANDAVPNFSACLDKNDIIHILFQDRHGNIVYMLYNHTSWDTRIILNSKNPSTYDKNLHIECCKDTVFYFYILEYSGSKLLSYQYLDKNNILSTPKVIDYVQDSSSRYNIKANNNNELHIFYKSSDGKHTCVGYKKYNHSKDQWSEFNTISDYKDKSDFLSANMDYLSNIHVCWQKVLPEGYELMHSFKSTISDKWSEAKKLILSQMPYLNASTLIVEDKIIVFWVKEGSIFYCLSNDKGKTWSKPVKYTLHDNKPSYCIVYNTNIKDEYHNSYFYDLPGKFTGGYRFAFLNDSEFNAEGVRNTEIAPVMAEAFKELSLSIEQLRQSLKEMNERVITLEIKLSQTEIESDKAQIRRNLVSSEINKLKADIEKLKDKPYSAKKQNRINTYPPSVNTENKHADPTRTGNMSEDTAKEYIKNENTMPQADSSEIPDSNMPVMPGAGFSYITPEFLRRMKEK